MKDIYLNLMEQQWTMQDIDEMDILYYFELLAYKANKEQEPTAYIDQCGI